MEQFETENWIFKYYIIYVKAGTPSLYCQMMMMMMMIDNKIIERGIIEFSNRLEHDGRLLNGGALIILVRGVSF